MDKVSPKKKLLIAAAVVASVATGIIVLKNIPTIVWPVGHPPPYNYCTEKAYYIRSCESSPYSVAAGTPGYSGQICGAHTWAFRGTDLFTYSMMDQGGKAYPRPSESAGEAVLKVWDDCYVKHQNTWPMGPACTTAVAPPGVQNYYPITLDQLKIVSPQQYNSYFVLFHCAQLTTTPATSPTATTVPAASPTPSPVCPPTKCPTCPPAPPTANKTRTPTPVPTGCLGPVGGCPTPTRTP